MAIPTPVPFGFTDRGLIERLYSEIGLANNLDDVAIGPIEDAVLAQFIVSAEQTVIIRLSQWFDPEDMIGDLWIQDRTTWIAAYKLSTRRGNEHYFQTEYDDALTELNAIATGELQPPHNIPLRFESTAAMSNFKIDERYRIAKTRVRPSISVGGTYPDQHTSLTAGFGFGFL